MSTEATPDPRSAGAEMTQHERDRRSVRQIIIVFVVLSVAFWFYVLLEYPGVLGLIGSVMWAVFGGGFTVWAVRQIKATSSEDQPTNRPSNEDEQAALDWFLFEEEDRNRREGR